MTDKQVAIWLAVMLVIEGVAIISVLWLGVSGKALKLHKLVGIGVILMALGLAVQIVRSLHYFEYGRYPVDHFFPLWILKDLGGSLIIFYLTFYWRKHEN